MLTTNQAILRLLSSFFILGMTLAQPIQLSITTLDATAGTVDINLTSQVGCSYCSDSEYPDEEKCTTFGSNLNNGVFDATWEFSTTMDATTCAGTCTDGVSYTETICEEGGGTWTDSETNGAWFDGNIKGFQFFLEGLIITSVSGGAAESLDYIELNSSADCDADGNSDTGCNLIVATSFGEASIPVSTDQLLFTAAFTDYNNVGLCFAGTNIESAGSWSAPTFSDTNGNEVDTKWPACDCSATSPMDECGVCGGDGFAANCVDSSDCDQMDCAGICTNDGGSAAFDNCGICDMNPGNDCTADCTTNEADCDSANWDGDDCWGGSAEEDCAGTCMGTVELDDCFLCGGTCENPDTENATGCNADGCCGELATDCAGECGGSAVNDCAGVCGGTAVNDCAGECGGSAVADACGSCGGTGVLEACDCTDTSGLNNDGCCDSLTPDCAGECGGSGVDTDMDDVCDTSDNCSDSPSGETVDIYGCTDDQNLSIIQISINIPSEFSISQNYPNPFNPTTSLSFDVDKTDEVSLIVYDLSGKEIITLASGIFTPGRYLVNWNAQNNHGEPVVSGMYVYRYTNSDMAITRKMLYLK